MLVYTRKAKSTTISYSLGTIRLPNTLNALSIGILDRPIKRLLSIASIENKGIV
jgi:hypothetical protein